MTTTLVAAAVLIFVAALLAAITAKNKPSHGKYSLCKGLLSPAEVAFDAILRRAVPELIICPKVRVADVVVADKNSRKDFLRISQKHFDWILCAPVTFLPLVAVELDDSSHSRKRNQISDETKNSAAASAGLKILRVKWANSYEEHDLRAQLEALINA